MHIILHNNQGSTLIESLLALTIYMMIVVYFVGSFTLLNQSRVRLNSNQETINKQELRIGEEGDDPKSSLKKVLR